MDGRKAVGGKVEVKIRIRDPYVTKQVEEVKEKWLVIDHFERRLPPAAPAAEVNSLLSTNSLYYVHCQEYFARRVSSSMWEVKPSVLNWGAA